MRYWTYSEIREKVRGDLGIEQEEFVSASELMGYCNMAIDAAESEIHTIYEDYFLTNSMVTTALGISNYVLPNDIYASKIRGVISLGSDGVYTIKRYSHMDSMFEVIESDKNSTNSEYKYLLTNSSAASGVEMELVPTPKKIEDIKLYYIRNANRMVDNDSVCDIPEFVDYVMQFMKVRCYEKEMHPNLSTAMGILEYKKNNMVNTLSNMVPDGDNLLQQDTSFYLDMGSGVDENGY